MGYGLHIVRTPNWVDAARSPITREEMNGLVDSDPELEWSASDYVDMKNEAGSVARYPMIRWHGLPCFWWYEDQIISKSPDQAEIAKLIHIARVLNAHVVGDEGERYLLRRDLLGREKIHVVQS